MQYCGLLAVQLALNLHPPLGCQGVHLHHVHPGGGWGVGKSAGERGLEITATRFLSQAPLIVKR